MKRIALTGIKPTGLPHVGNYLGMIRPALELVRDYQALYFVADYHALTTLKDRDELRRLTYEVAATWLALGLDPERVIFYRQSDIPEVCELAWILGCFASKGLLNRAHAYKTAVDENQAAGRDADLGMNMGLFGYPVLMAADILLFGAHVVPVGLDQKQHVEIARDIAQAFNNQTGRQVLTVPEAQIHEAVMTIPGTDGRKMSKSYDNTLPLFAPAADLRKRVMRIVTDSKRPEDPKDPTRDNLVAILRHFASPERLGEVEAGYRRGGLAYSEIKQELFELLEQTFGGARSRYDRLVEDRASLDRILESGATKARALATPIMERVRQAVGIRG